MFFFQPYPGAWAKDHYKNVIVHRFDTASQSYMHLADYSLAGHYCNCAVGAGRYLLISFWPFEEEAMRTIWECLKVGRAMEKELKSKTKEIDELKAAVGTKDAEISRLNALIVEKDAYIVYCQEEMARLNEIIRSKNAQLARARYEAKVAIKAAAREAALARKEAAAARSAAALVRRQQRESDAMWRQQRQSQERARSERLRLRDPIHIYALAGGTTGSRKEDWVLVLDYHKGAHDLRLGAMGPDGTQTLEVTEHDNVFRFDLLCPADISSIAAVLPVVPGKLCSDF